MGERTANPPADLEAIRRYAQANVGCIGRISLYPSEVMDLFAEADKWRSIADQLAGALAKVSANYTEADKNRRDGALVRYNEAAG